MDDGWAAGDSGAVTTARGVRSGAMGRSDQAHCGYSKTNIRLGQVESFPGWKLAWKSATKLARGRRELLLGFRLTGADRLVPREFCLARLYERRVAAGGLVKFWLLACS